MPQQLPDCHRLIHRQLVLADAAPADDGDFIRFEMLNAPLIAEAPMQLGNPALTINRTMGKWWKPIGLIKRGNLV